MTFSIYLPIIFRTIQFCPQSTIWRRNLKILWNFVDLPMSHNPVTNSCIQSSLKKACVTHSMDYRSMKSSPTSKCFPIQFNGFMHILFAINPKEENSNPNEDTYMNKNARNKFIYSFDFVQFPELPSIIMINP